MKPRSPDQLPILPNIGLEAPMELLFSLDEAAQLIPCRNIEYLRKLLSLNKTKLSTPKYSLHGKEHRRHRLLTLTDLQTLRSMLVHTVERNPTLAVQWIAENFDELSLQVEITDRKNP